MMLHAKYQGSWSCALRQKDCFTFSLYYKNAYVEHVTLGAGHLLPQGHNLNKLGIAGSDKNIFFMFSLYYTVISCMFVCSQNYLPEVPERLDTLLHEAKGRVQ